MFKICERVLNDEIWNMCLLFGSDVIKFSFFLVMFFFILIEKMCIFWLCSKVVFFCVFFWLVDILFVIRMMILEVFVFVVLNIDVFVYFKVLLVFVDFLEEYWIWFIFDIMIDRLEKLWNLNIFVMELLKVKVLNFRDRELRFWINFFINIFMVLKLYGFIVFVLFIIIKIFVVL